jgi:N-acetylglucosaminyl-diphospho-decaprenol L-rhamnosyltransferase
VTRTSVVIVAYRSCEELQQGLRPLLEDGSVGDIVVVDNSSDPATAELVGSLRGRVRYLDPGANLGFARGCNLGMRRSRDPVVTFLNPDVELVRELADLVERCAAGGPHLWAGGLTSRPADTSLSNARRAVTLGGELRRAVLGARTSVESVPLRVATRRVAQADGAFLMAGREFLEALGGFDERFELYFEDVDLCDRARSAGGVVMDTRRFGDHLGRASARKAGALSYCVFRVSRIRYFAKRNGLAGALAALLVTAVEMLVRSVTRQPEGWRVRLRALALAGREAGRPGSVRVLS